MTMNLRVSLWRAGLVGLALLGASAVLAETCNPNTQSTFTSWTGNGDTVTDTATGLVWQRCAYGQGWNGGTCIGTAFTSAWAAAVTGAPSGWRLPNIKELESIVERQCASPAMNTAAFPAVPSVNFWSSTPGWAVSFNDGSVLSGQAAGTGMAVRYVQGGNAFSAFDAGPGAATNCSPNVPQDRTPSQLVVNADDTVTDQTTGLTWRRCAEGMAYAGGRCSSVSTYNTYSWQLALAVPAQSGNAGWRVPNVKELESLVDRSCANPAVSGGRFPDQPAVDFWSSTPGWAVSFSDGSVLSGQTYSAANALRLVKGGASAAVSFTTSAGGAGLCTTQAPSDFKRAQWIENADGTLFDSGTGMTWDRCVIGQTWSATLGACTSTPTALTWSSALQRANLASFFGSNSWRVPNVKELESIVDRRCSSPALNPELFRGNQETMTWSSTPGWAVNMADGSVLSGQAASTVMAVRLVRGGIGAAAYDAALAGVPGSVLGGPSAVQAAVVNPTLLLPTSTNQKLIFLTHGWNSDTNAWPSTLAQVLCARLGAQVQNGAASISQLAVTDYCSTADWKVVAFNWKPFALDLPNVLPWRALSNAGHMGEKVGKILAGAASKYSFVHLVGHSAGANLIHELGRQLRLANGSVPKIQATFLDAFCGYPDRCDYGYWSDWADSYIEKNDVVVNEGTETRMTLCNAANFDVTASYPIALEGAVPDVVYSTARHAWPYQCYGDSATDPNGGSSAFNVLCLGNAAGNIGFGLSYFGSGATNATSFFGTRNSINPKGSLQKLTAINVFAPGQSAVCGVGVSDLSNAIAAITNPITSVANTVGNGVLGAGATCATAQLVTPVFTPLGIVARLLTCNTSTVKAGIGVKAAGSEPVTSWSVLNVNVGRRTNQMQFALQFTNPVNAVLTVYADDSQVYRTTQELRANAIYDTGPIDIPALERGSHKISFRLDSIDGLEAAVELSSLRLSGANLCDLDVDGDGAMTVARDGALLLRYLMGFRGDGLTAGLGISDANAAQAIADYVGSAVQFDVFGRPSSAPLATTDGLVLLRMMLGMSDDALLSGIAVPSGALFATSSAVRANVNGKCGTRF